MNYTKDLLPDEKVLFSTKKHLIIFFYPFLLLVFCVIAFNYMQTNLILKRLDWVPLLIAGIFMGFALIEYYFSQFVVTSKRLWMCEGFFNRHTMEMRITTISQVNVDQNLIGQILDFGTVSINAFGAYDYFPLIAKPRMFQKMVNAQIDTIVK